ncbi:hemolysin family protein [Actinomycetaceae bacterium TAE3-ERU4]|nr:hemolysin family protein [Actinomycetaceae bacterium TAE3-ERU4]
MVVVDRAAEIPGITLTIVAILFYLLSGALNAVERSLERLSRASAEDLVEDGRRGGEIVLAQVSDRDRTARSVRSVRLFFQTLSTIFLTLVFIQTDWSWWIVSLVALFTNWGLLAILGSTIPRQFSVRWPEGTMLSLRWLTNVCIRVNTVFDPLLRFFGGLRNTSTQTEAEARHEMADDLREMVDQVGEAELFEDEDRQMLRSVFELGQTLVREVMLPRTEMITIGDDQSLEKAMHLFVRSGFSRIPVVGDDSDDIKGVIYFKDCMRRLMTNAGESKNLVTVVMRPAHFIPETLYADDLLRMMQRDSFHLALAVDEWGGIAGLVTLEDLLEEVVGELTDEHDAKEHEPRELEPGVWSVPSRLPIDELGEIFGFELDDEDVDSVGGLVAKILNKVPLPGASVSVKGLEITALEAIGRRKQVANYRVSRAPEPRDV